MTYRSVRYRTRSALYIHKVHKDTLCGLGTEVNGILGILGHTLECLEHQVELSDIGEVVLSAGRARNIVVFDEGFHLSLGESIYGLFENMTCLGAPIFYQFIRAESLFALAAVHKRIREASEMSRSDPRLGIHEDRRILTDVIWIFLNEFFPPCAFDVVFQLNSERAIVPCVGKSAVNFRSGKDKAAVFAQCDDLFHCFFFVVHCRSSFYFYK